MEDIKTFDFGAGNLKKKKKKKGETSPVVVEDSQASLIVGMCGVGVVEDEPIHSPITRMGRKKSSGNFYC